MARVRKLKKDGSDGDAILVIVGDEAYDAELFVVGPGCRTYMTVHTKDGGFVCFSGPKTLQALADALNKALKRKDL